MVSRYALVFACIFSFIAYACLGDSDSPTSTSPSDNAGGSSETTSPVDDTTGNTNDDSATTEPTDGATDGSNISTPSDHTDILSTSPAAMTQAFAPYAKVGTRYDDNYFYVESDGIPKHQMMVNITAWIAQVPLPQPYTGDNAWPIPLHPQYAANPISIETDLQRGAIAVAANGIPIFNPLYASGLVSKEIGELDDFGDHSGRADDYHYHAAPPHLESTSGIMPIAYGLDGFAVYGSTDPDSAPMRALDEYHLPRGQRWFVSLSWNQRVSLLNRRHV